MRVVSVEQMRELERLTFAAGTSEAELQQRAGTAVGRAVAELDVTRQSVVALVGSGNNGRDAWIAAETLARAGWDATLYLTPRHAVAEAELRGFVGLGGHLLWHPETMSELAVESALASAGVAVDGLLGIGASGAPRPPLDTVITTLNAVRARRPDLQVVAVDAPSGLDADSGAAEGAAVTADLTVVLGGAKRGLLSPSAAAYTGRLVFAAIGVVDALLANPEVLDPSSVRGLLARSATDAHKGSFGRLLVAAGSERYLGAAYLVCAAAVRTGAGIVTLAAPRWLRDVVAARLSETTYLVLPDDGPARAAEASAQRILDELERYDALAIGPGLSTDGAVGDFVETILRGAAAVGRPVVVDADALNALATRPSWPQWIGARAILTPHLGELRRLAPTATDAPEEPWEEARRLAADWGVTLVMKGPFTAVGSGPRAWVHPRPNPALATGGTGDVLTGIVGGLLARRLAPSEAARLGVFIHGSAGAQAAAGVLAGGLMASDLLPAIPAALGAALPIGAERA